MPSLNAIHRRASVMLRSSSNTPSELSTQWSNPSDILSLLLIIGGDIIQAALAQLSGGLITPVCFSFGWVAYSFTTLAVMMGSGELMPRTDYPCKVVNTETGNVRENRSWLLGRLLRDAEVLLEEEALCISIYEATDGEQGHDPAGKGSRDFIWYMSLLVMFVQCGIAAIPFLWDDYGVFMITAAGTLLALITGALPQWRIEKYACRANSKKIIALKVGNGFRQIVIIKGNGKTLDFEDLAAGNGPKLRRSWDNFGWFTKESSEPYDKQGDNAKKKKAMVFKGLPIDFWITRLLCMILVGFWVAILITVSGLKLHSWFILIVGAIGMTQNAIVAAISRKPETRGIHLRKQTELRGSKVMDVLMDLECFIPGSCKSLVEEYFPGGIRPNEELWWSGNRKPYDDERYEQRETRGVPPSMVP